MGYIIIWIVLLLFIGLTVYGMVSSKKAEKNTRQVDARVLACVPKQIDSRYLEQTASFFDVTVDFIGLQGATVTKTFPSKKKYAANDVIRCRYDDQKDRLYTDTENTPENNFSSGVIILAACLFIFAITLCGFWISTSHNGQTPEWIRYVLGYFTGILFTGIGIIGAMRMRRFQEKKSHMLPSEGTLVNYRKEMSHGSHSTPIYYPIYEYGTAEDAKHLHSHLGGNAKKYRQLGRKVHILTDPLTGEVFCEEDEKSSMKLRILFLVLGILILGFMAASNLGYLTLH